MAQPVELWPEILERPEYVALAEGYRRPYAHADHQVALNAHKLLEASQFLGGRALPCSFARQILHLAKAETLEQWLEEVNKRNRSRGYGPLLHRTLWRIVSPAGDPALGPLPQPITFHRTASRAFEVAYWKTIAELSAGRFLNKDNADCVRDPASESLRKRPDSDLPALGDYLLAYYRKLIAKHGMSGKAEAGELPFSWQTDFSFPWMEGWNANQPSQAKERNLMVVIPGRDHRRAVIMADHYDTAYMEDVYYPARGGKLARVAAAGADDNHSATAALMLAAPVFLELSRAGKLDCDIWLIHLTGEEFPADCIGARHLAQWLVEGSLGLRQSGGKQREPLGREGRGGFRA